MAGCGKQQSPYAPCIVYLPSENHHVQWVNPLFQWQFSIAMLVNQRVHLFLVGGLEHFLFFHIWE